MDTEHVIEFNVHSNIHLKRKILANEPLKDVSSWLMDIYENLQRTSQKNTEMLEVFF